MATLALAALTLVGGGAAATTFTDPAGDSEGAPDITSVVVANDLAGVVTFTIAVANQPVLAADGELVLALDSDADEGTGDSGGFDYVFDLRGSDQSWSFGHWNGATYDFNVPATTLKIAYSAGVATIAVNRSELSNTRKLDFYVFSVQVDANEETLAQMQSLLAGLSGKVTTAVQNRKAEVFWQYQGDQQAEDEFWSSEA